MEGGKVMFALLGIVALCSLVAIIISAITLSRPTQVPTINLSGLGGGGAPPVIIGGGGSCSGGDANERTTYRIAVGHDSKVRTYFDEQGYLQGYYKELVTEVCSAAGISCATIWDKSTNCWQSKPGEHSSGGQGLMGNWYDGCMGWWKTVGRTMVFDFSEPFLKTPVDYLFIRKGDTFDPRHMKDNQSIGLMDGWAQDEKCLARYNISLKDNQVRLFTETSKLLQELEDGKIDAFFSTVDHFAPNNKTEKLEPPMQCALAGNGLMTRKDSPLLGHWNRGYNTLRSNGRYHRHCGDVRKRHGHRGGVLSCLE